MERKLSCSGGVFSGWECYASGANIPKFAKLIIENKDPSKFRESLLYTLSNGNLDNLNSKMIYDAAKRGDSLAMEIVRKIGEVNAMGFASVINVFDPELITVGGSVAINNRELVMPYIIEGVKKYVVNRVPKIVVTSLGEDIGLLGALALAMHPEFLPDRFK